MERRGREKGENLDRKRGDERREQETGGVGRKREERQREWGTGSEVRSVEIPFLSFKAPLLK